MRALPIFGDEAIVLRLAALLRKDPSKNFWISLQEASAPLHPWLLALFLPVSRDPVYAGRLLSVAVAVLTVPATAWATLHIAEAFRGSGEQDDVSGPAVSIAACAMVAFCPFFVFAQRIARVDALFLLQTVLVAGASVALAFRVNREASLFEPALGFGFLMGLTMLTRQAVSYPLWALPVAALVFLDLGQERLPSVGWRRLGHALAIALVVAGALWVPMLIAPDGPSLMARIFHSAEYRPTMGAGERLRLTLGNGALAVEAFWAYLTAPVLVAALLGSFALGATRRWKLLGFLLSWEAILLAPTVLFAANYFPRYALPAALPLLVAAGFGIAWVWTSVEAPSRSALARVVLALALAAGLLGPSFRELWFGERDWKHWSLLAIDREQFLSGWSAGFASEAAVRFLADLARKRPILVLTPEFTGNPSDAVWLLLAGHPRVRLSYATDALREPFLVPAPGRSGTYWLHGDIREATTSAVTLGEGESTYIVSTDPLLTRTGWTPAGAFFAGRNPGLSEVARFDNPPDGSGRVTSAVVILRLH